MLLVYTVGTYITLIIWQTQRFYLGGVLNYFKCYAFNCVFRKKLKFFFPSVNKGSFRVRVNFVFIEDLNPGFLFVCVWFFFVCFFLCFVGVRLKVSPSKLQAGDLALCNK